MNNLSCVRSRVSRAPHTLMKGTNGSRFLDPRFRNIAVTYTN